MIFAQEELKMIWLSSNVTEQIFIEKYFSFFEVHYENGYDFPGETHNFWECLYVLEGTLCVSGDERVYNMAEGEIIFHKPLELHKFYVNNENGATLLIFSYSLDGKLSDYLKNKVFRLSEEQEYIAASMLRYMHRCWANMGTAEDTSLYRQDYLSLFERIPTFSQMITTYIYQLLLSLIDDGSLSRVSTARDAIVYSQAVNYMNSQICSQPSVTDIADFCHISEASLKRVFRKYAGISIHKYFLKLKIKTAAGLMDNGLSVTETADQLGFSSQAYFSTVFKRETGVCPNSRQQRNPAGNLTGS